MTTSRERTRPFKSASIRENPSTSGFVIWNSAFRMPGMTPKVFFNAPVMMVKAWVFSLGRLTMKPESSTPRATWKRLFCAPRE